MKKIASFLYVFCLLCLIGITGAIAQTLNVTAGNVTYQFPASKAGDMTYNNGTTLTVMDKTFTLSDVSSMKVDTSAVTDNLVLVNYDDASTTVTIAGNVAKYVTVSISGSHVTITQTNTDDVDGDEITYQLTGSASDGEFVLNGSYKCTVSLAGVTLHNPSGAAITINNSKRIQLSAKKETINSLSDGANGSQKACIYSKGQIQLQGNGTLNVAGNTAHAIKSGDYISVKNMTLNVTGAVKDGISCNAYFLMKGGTVTITGVGDDGIQCDLDGETATAATDDDHSDEDTGNIYIEDGVLNVTAPNTTSAGKCVKAEGSVLVSGGTIKLEAKGAIDLTDATDPSYTTGFKADGNFTQTGGSITITVTGAAGRGISVNGSFITPTSNTGTLTITNSGATSASTSSASTKYFCSARGIKAGAVSIAGGTINITTSGTASKGIKADSGDGTGDITISGGTVTIKVTGAAAIDYSESDAKGCAGLNADNNINISGGTITLTASSTGGKGLKCDNILTVSGGALTATASGSNYSSGSYSASAKAIKAGTKTAASSVKAMGPGGPGGGFGPGGGGGGDNGNYTYSGGIVVTGGSITASASAHEAIESKNTIDISGGYVYAYSKDDAINSASTFTITDGFVMGNSSGNDGLDANGNFYIKGGTVFAVATTSPEVGIDANTEGGYALYITGGTVVAIGGLESGSSISGTAKSASYTKGNTYALYNNGTLALTYKVPSNSSMSTTMAVVTSGTPTLFTATGSGTTFWNGYGYTNCTKGSSVTLSSYSSGGGGGGGRPW